jgi:hypothetical protein
MIAADSASTNEPSCSAGILARGLSAVSSAISSGVPCRISTGLCVYGRPISSSIQSTRFVR